MPDDLQDRLKDKDVEVRISAVNFLRTLKDRTATIPLLIGSLEDGDWRVRKTALEALLEIKGDEVIKGLISTLSKDNPGARNSAIEGLIALGADATGHLLQAFNNAGPDIRKFIIDILGCTGDLNALPLLLRAVEDPDENVRAGAIEQLGNLHDFSAIDALISILTGGDTWLAYHAANALGKIGNPKTVDALISVLPEKTLRIPALSALGQIADERSLSKVVPHLKDDSRAVREETIKALRHFFIKGVSGEKIIEELKNALGDEVFNILMPYTRSHKKDLSIATTLLLVLLKDKNAIAPLLEEAIEEEFQEEAIKALVFIGKTEPESLIPFFNVSDPYQRRVICDVAYGVGATVFFDPLIRLLKDEDGHVRAKAALALSRIANPSSIPHIKALLTDEYEDVQESAITSLSRLKNWLNLDEIIRGLSHKNPLMRRNSAILLGLIGTDTLLEPLAVALKDSDVRVRVAVVDAIGSINGADALRHLLLALSDESWEVRRSAVIAIGRMGTEEVVEPLILMLKDPDAGVRAQAARSLANTGNKKAIEPLIGLLGDESGFVKTIAIESLSLFNKEARVKEVLRRLLNDKDPEVRGTAIESLSKFQGVAQDISLLLRDDEWSVRKRAVDVLGRFFKEECLTYLKEVAETDRDPDVRAAAARYLGV